MLLSPHCDLGQGRSGVRMVTTIVYTANMYVCRYHCIITVLDTLVDMCLTSEQAPPGKLPCTSLVVRETPTRGATEPA